MMMDRRTFLFSSASVATAPGVGLQAETAPAPAIPAPMAFADWRDAFARRAVERGFTDSLVQAQLAGLEADPRVTALDGRQPEFSKPIGDYLAGAAGPARVRDARARREGAAAWLDPISARAGVPAEILVAVWGIESSFGQIQGDMDVVRSLATLAAQGRRRAWAESQLLACLRIIASGEAGRAQLKGSWAGAMGQTQFTPEDYLAYAVDADGDGRRDIWSSQRDALGSTGNFLAKKASWRPGVSWQREVLLPDGFDYGVTEGPSLPPADWSARGVRTADGAGFRAADAASPAQLIVPQGWMGPAFLTFPNHKAIRAYNNSVSYALAVGLLADGIAGAGPLARAWPKDQPISLADRIAAQEALTRLGYDPGAVDGVLGTGTRRAARLWQAARGLPADGYLSYALVQRLKADGPGAV